MYIGYGTACATSANEVRNLGGGVRGVRKSSVRVSTLPPRPPVSPARDGSGRRKGATGADARKPLRQPRARCADAVAARRAVARSGATRLCVNHIIIVPRPCPPGGDRRVMVAGRRSLVTSGGGASFLFLLAKTWVCF